MASESADNQPVLMALCRALIAAAEGRKADAAREIDTARRLADGLQELFHCALCGADRPEGKPCEEHPMMPVRSGSGAARRQKLADAGLETLGKP